MKRQSIKTLLVATFCLIALPLKTWAYGGGTGTPEDPYLIDTAEHLNAIGAEPNDWDKHFTLTADIDLSAYAPNHFNLIGIYKPAQDPNERIELPFSGVFDGQGHTIANFTYEVTGDEDPIDGWVYRFGIFRIIDGADAEIRDLTLRDPNLYPAPSCIQRVGTIGALAGELKSGRITRCHVEGGSILAEGGAGGLVGSAQRLPADTPTPLPPSISYCSTHGAVLQAPLRPFVDAERADLSLHKYYGGLLGFNGAPISDCNASGPVSGAQLCGGLVGRNTGDITLCHATGPVSGEYCIGGLVGECYFGTISSSWAGGDVTGLSEEPSQETSPRATSIGGLAGSCHRATVSDCYATGDVTGDSHVGGLAGGFDDGTIQRCSATGSVTATNQQAGGLLGSTGPDAIVSECCASAAVSARWAAGGLVGLNGGTIQYCWAAGHVSGVSGLGGLVGENWKWIEIIWGTPLEYDGVITDCYALTDVTCEEARAGGLLGVMKGGTLSRCYAAGHVFGPQDIGGLIGQTNTEYPSTVVRSFWDINATGLPFSAGGAGLTTPQMQDRDTYIAAGWDFTEETDNGNDDVWYFLETNDYPRLAWERQDQTIIEP